MSKPTIRRFLELNNGELPNYALPGCYPIVYYNEGGEPLCSKCVNSVLKQVQKHPDEDWEASIPQHWDIYYEGPVIQCSECGTSMESAYSDPEEDN